MTPPGDLQAVLQAGDDARDEQIVGLSNLETDTLTTTGNVTIGGNTTTTFIKTDDERQIRLLQPNNSNLGYSLSNDNEDSHFRIYRENYGLDTRDEMLNIDEDANLTVLGKVSSNILEAEVLQLGTVANYNGIIKPVEGRILVFEGSPTGGNFHYTGKNSFTAGITTRWDSNGERGSVLYRADNGVQGLEIGHSGIDIYDYSNQDIKYNI